MEREAKRLAEQLIESYGEAAMYHPRPLIADLREDHGLDNDREDVDAFERHIRWPRFSLHGTDPDVLARAIRRNLPAEVITALVERLSVEKGAA